MQNSYKVEFMKLSFSALGMLKLKKKKKKHKSRYNFEGMTGFCNNNKNLDFWI